VGWSYGFGSGLRVRIKFKVEGLGLGLRFRWFRGWVRDGLVLELRIDFRLGLRTG
jgi:hypothetical protein